jgi:hypothetical protein
MPTPDITRSPSLTYTDTVEGDEGKAYFDYSKNIVDSFVPHAIIALWNTKLLQDAWLNWVILLDWPSFGIS